MFSVCAGYCCKNQKNNANNRAYLLDNRKQRANISLRRGQGARGRKEPQTDMDTNTTDKFITIIDHTTGSWVNFTFHENAGRNKLEAAVRAALTGYTRDDSTYRVILAIKTKKGQYVAIMVIGRDGSIDDFSTDNNLRKLYTFTVTPDMIQH